MSLRDLQLNFPRTKLIEVLTANRAKHEADYNDAVKAFRVKVREICANKIEHIDAGKPIRVDINAPVPEKHLDEYDQVIEMLTMTSDAVIPLNHYQFRSFVQDKWDWSQSFTSNTLSYKS